MARAKRICPRLGCHRVVQGRYCVEHNREYEAKRGTPEQRGYDHAHRKMRANVALAVEAGRAICSRCELPISPGDLWHLDHDDTDRTKYLGPAHARCNTSAGGLKAHLYQ